MKALITIIILALVAWGIWSLIDKNPEPGLNNQEAAQEETLNNIGTGGPEEGADELNEFEDKG